MAGISDTEPFVIDGALWPAQRVAIMYEVARRGSREAVTRRLAQLVRMQVGVRASQAQLAQQALRVAQRAGYSRAWDPAYFQPVKYTAIHGGDCEDLTPLLAAICTNLGLSWRIEWLDQPDKPLNHVALQIEIDGRWYWADPSVCGARLGEYPYDAIARLGQWHVLYATMPGGACAVE